MPIKVSIVEDAEIRAAIKEMIEGQFRALVREEVSQQLQGLVTETVTKSITDEKLLNLAKYSLKLQWDDRTRLFRKKVKEYIDRTYGADIESEIQKCDISKMIRGIISDRVKIQ